MGINFDGTDDYIPTTMTGISGTNPRTVEAYIRTTANCDPNKGGKQKVIVDWGTSSTGARFTSNILWGNALRVEVAGSGLSGQTAINDGIWHHVAVVYNPSATLQLSLYVDGILDTAGNIPTTINTGSTVKVIIGQRVDGANPFDGDIDEVRIYNYARTDSAIKADMKASYCQYPTGLVAYYKLNEGTANGSNKTKTTATDYISAKNGTLTNFALSGSSSNWVVGSDSLKDNSNRDTIKVLECYEYTSNSGKKYTSSGTYIENFTNAKGCDSIEQINLTIGRSFKTEYYTVCDSFVTYLGKVGYTTGIYRDTFFNANSKGCDSIVLMSVTVNKSIETNETLPVCDSAKINGVQYYSNATISLPGKSSKNCDSTHFIHLVVNPSTINQFSETQCNSYKSSLGNVYTKTGIYTERLSKANQYGCDSVMIIDLTIHKAIDTTIMANSCDSFQSPSGKKYFTTGIYPESFTSQYGCDSIITYDLTINKSKKGNEKMVTCDSAFVNQKWYYDTKIFSFTTPSASGCDSVVSVDLNITTINDGLTLSGKTLEATQKNATYQWYNCTKNEDVAGATSDTFTPINSGEYAVKLSLNSCQKMSECVFVTGLGYAKLKQQMFNIYPNPSQKEFHISGLKHSNAQLDVFDVSGRMVLSVLVSNNSLIKHNLSAGVYQVVISNGSELMHQQLVVE
ncbi:MAG: T9SS type A sorting domain-containing protein [Flavobacteriales bacterium]|nr:T9SS type A sorting domain-containing protein [Flavobacteriales bacterium]